MSNPQATFFATLIDEWVRGGVTDAVIAPGNRSTLMSALIMADGRLRLHVMVDERSASFFALGLGLATGRPAVFWCTSGTATAEAHAAVIEAHQAGVPSLVCTADRPPEVHHVRDWQSVDQQHIYGRSPRWFFDPGVADDAARSTWRSIGARSVLETTNHPMGPGPVHLNLPIREPWSLDLDELPAGRADGAPWHTAGKRKLDHSSAIEVLRPFVGQRGLIIVGSGMVGIVGVTDLADALGWPILAEARSDCRVPRDCVIAYADELVRVPSFADTHRPDVVLRLGSPALSKPVAQWLKASDATEFVVDPYDRWLGAAVEAKHILEVDPGGLGTSAAQAFLNHPKPEDWAQEWRTADDTAELALTKALEELPLSEPAIARTVAATLPTGAALFAATSMPVREVESYAPRSWNGPVLASRGASGMDGIVSTAGGVAAGKGQPVTLLIGDLTFLYDLNALWVLRGAAASIDLTVVVVDNNGGGIFSLLPQLASVEPATFEKVVATPQNVDIPAVVRAFGLDVVEVKTAKKLAKALTQNTGNLRVIHVRTDRAANVNHHARIHAAIAAAIQR